MTLSSRTARRTNAGPAQAVTLPRDSERKAAGELLLLPDATATGELLPLPDAAAAAAAAAAKCVCW